MAKPYSVLLALGSNIERQKNMPLAISILRQHPRIKLCAVSPIYESIPVGKMPKQYIFYDAAAWVETDLDPQTLRSTLHKIEEKVGRTERGEDKPRPIDLDIVLYGQQILQLEALRIPDPDIARYPHIALPLADIAPNWVHPELGLTLRQIADNLNYDKSEIKKI